MHKIYKKKKCNRERKNTSKDTVNRELFHNKKEETYYTQERLEILKSKVRSARVKMNKNKTTGSDRIVIEMLSALHNFRINKIMKINEIYDSSNILEDLRTIFITLPKKVSANQCKLHWTISLTNLKTKLSEF